MKKHTRLYYKHFGYALDENIPCEVCGNIAVDLHHIDNKGMGGSKTKDYIHNIIALCRDCHDKAHNEQLSKDELYKIHERRINS